MQMQLWGKTLYRWLPAIIMMLVIFIASATPASQIHNFGTLDLLVKKTGHFTAYALLAVCYAYGLGLRKARIWLLALVFAMLFATSDEYHQIFTPGRHPAFTDILIDSIGATTGLFMLSRYLRRAPQPDSTRSVHRT